MNTSDQPRQPCASRSVITALLPLRWALALALSLPLASGAAEFGQAFATPQQALSALEQAAASAAPDALRALFGPAAEELQNPDRVQATNELKAFTTALLATNCLVSESATRYVLEVGSARWPFPIPIVQHEGRWFFDTAAGKDEILSRRIGRNELATLQVVRAYAIAQREYASHDRIGDGVLQYAQRLSSSPGTKDGLYWPLDLDGELSPLGPLVAEAQGEGYALRTGAASGEPAPFHGYYFKILTRQGTHAPGGKYSYVINRRMIAGFALVAWPAAYGESGIMTFIINQQGRVYQKDLGPRTARLARKLNEYDPDASWQLSLD